MSARTRTPLPIESWRAYLLLLHKLRVRAVIHDIGTKHGCGKMRVDFLRIHIRKLPIQDEFVSIYTEVDYRLAAKQDEGKDIAVL
jgi:hypothetical protein